MIEFYAYPIIALLFVGVFCREVIAPASQNRCDHRWLLMSAGLGVSTVVVTLGIGLVFAKVIERNALIHASLYMPDVLVGVVSFLIASFIFYWWHRATHKFDFLWRVFHQLHHSAPRVEALTAFYAHPMDTAAAVLISSFSSYVILGASPFAAGVALILTGAFDLFLHSDVRTPTWLGFWVQRPEMHTIHHAKDHHAQNYGLPLWDIVFGTWTNPRERVSTLGFDPDKSERITDMLLWRDVHRSDEAQR